MKVNSHTRGCINEDLTNAIGCEDLSKYINFINESLGREGLHLVCEDGTPFEGFFCGEQGRTTIEMADRFGNMVENSLIVFEWYKLTTRYDINCYMS